MRDSKNSIACGPGPEGTGAAADWELREAQTVAVMNTAAVSEISARGVIPTGINEVEYYRTGHVPRLCVSAFQHLSCCF
jgi:hypothetical protein